MRHQGTCIVVGHHLDTEELDIVDPNFADVGRDVEALPNDQTHGECATVAVARRARGRLSDHHVAAGEGRDSEEQRPAQANVHGR